MTKHFMRWPEPAPVTSCSEPANNYKQLHKELFSTVFTSVYFLFLKFEFLIHDKTVICNETDFYRVTNVVVIIATTIVVFLTIKFTLFIYVLKRFCLREWMTLIVRQVKNWCYRHWEIMTIWWE